jgi:hypothetical protein
MQQLKCYYYATFWAILLHDTDIMYYISHFPYMIIVYPVGTTINTNRHYNHLWYRKIGQFGIKRDYPRPNALVV